MQKVHRLFGARRGSSASEIFMSGLADSLPVSSRYSRNGPNGRETRRAGLTICTQSTPRLDSTHLGALKTSPLVVSHSSQNKVTALRCTQAQRQRPSTSRLARGRARIIHFSHSHARHSARVYSPPHDPATRLYPPCAERPATAGPACRRRRPSGTRARQAPLAREADAQAIRI